MVFVSDSAEKLLHPRYSIEKNPSIAIQNFSRILNLNGYESDGIWHSPILKSGEEHVDLFEISEMKINIGFISEAFDGKEKEEREKKGNKSRNDDGRNDLSPELLDTVTGTPTSLLLKIDKHTVSKITKSVYSQLTDLRLWKSAGLNTVLDPKSLLRTYLDLFQSTELTVLNKNISIESNTEKKEKNTNDKNGTNDYSNEIREMSTSTYTKVFHCQEAVNLSSAKSDIDWLLRIRIQLFSLFLRLFGKDDYFEYTRLENQPRGTKEEGKETEKSVIDSTCSEKNKKIRPDQKNKKTSKELEKQKLKDEINSKDKVTNIESDLSEFEMSAWLMSFSVCGFLSDVYESTSTCTVQNARTYEQSKTVLKMNSKKRKHFLPNIFEKLSTVLNAPLNRFPHVKSVKMKDGKLLNPLENENENQSSICLDDFLKNLVNHFFHHYRNLFSLGENNSWTSDLLLGNSRMSTKLNGVPRTEDFSHSMISDVLFFLISDISLSQIIDNAVVSILTLKNQKIGIDILLKTFHGLENNFQLLNYFTSSLSPSIATPSFSSLSFCIAFSTNDLNQRSNFVSFPISKIEKVRMENTENLIENITMMLIKYGTKCSDEVGGGIFGKTRLALFLFLLRYIGKYFYFENGCIDSGSPFSNDNFNSFLTGILSNELSATSSKNGLTLYNGNLEFKMKREFVERLILNTLNTFIHQSTMKSKTNSVSKSSIKLISNKNRDILDSEIGHKAVKNCNKKDTKIIFSRKSFEVKSILQNHLKLLFLCQKSHGSFLSPTRLHLLTSTPVIETSVISAQGSFVLGENVKLIGYAFPNYLFDDFLEFFCNIITSYYILFF